MISGNNDYSTVRINRVEPLCVKIGDKYEEHRYKIEIAFDEPMPSVMAVDLSAFLSKSMHAEGEGLHALLNLDVFKTVEVMDGGGLLQWRAGEKNIKIDAAIFWALGTFQRRERECRIEDVEALTDAGAKRLRINFRKPTSASMTVDMADIIGDETDPSLAALRDLAVFRKAEVAHFGGAVKWEEDVFVAAKTLFALGKKQQEQTQPLIAEAIPEEHTLVVTFRRPNLKGPLTTDLSPFIKHIPAFAPLQKPDVFMNVKVLNNGGALSWASGHVPQMSASTVFIIARAQQLGFDRSLFQLLEQNWFHHMDDVTNPRGSIGWEDQGLDITSAMSVYSSVLTGHLPVADPIGLAEVLCRSVHIEGPDSLEILSLPQPHVHARRIQGEEL